MCILQWKALEYSPINNYWTLLKKVQKGILNDLRPITEHGKM